eukprot:c9906_g1_i1.p2 GENE.c9906_g1_i1~~c9906_g1_i1.p2  ORF type:complete len:215 (-),score=43.20 c9906_g1_i1:756-1361(-)
MSRLRQLCIVGASGAGKSTLVRRLQSEFPTVFGFSVSHTTRSPRPGEQHGVHYFFVDHGQFEQLVNENRFLEHAYVHTNRYGTSFDAIKAVEDQKRICILDVDVQGANAIRTARDQGLLNPYFVFIQAPSLEELKARLEKRGTESEETLRVRLANAEKEMSEAHKFDHVIVNDNLDEAYAALRNVLSEEISKAQSLGSAEN